VLSPTQLRPDAVLRVSPSSYGAWAVLPLARPTATDSARYGDLLPSLHPPAAALAAPATVGACGQLPLDAAASTGGGARSLAYTFGVESADAEAAVVAKRVLARAARAASAAGDASRPVLDAAALPTGASYLFQVTVTDYLGGVSSARAQVDVVSEPVPLLWPVGGAMHFVRRGAPTILQVAVQAADEQCAALVPANRTMTFEWRQLHGPPLLRTSFTDDGGYAAFVATARTPALYLAPLSLQVRTGHSYVGRRGARHSKPSVGVTRASAASFRSDSLATNSFARPQHHGAHSSSRPPSNMHDGVSSAFSRWALCTASSSPQRTPPIGASPPPWRWTCQRRHPRWRCASPEETGG